MNIFFVLKDILPLAVFFLCYKFFGIIAATASLMISTIAIVAMHIIFKQKMNTSFIVSSALMIIMGCMTIFTQNTTFIKMKPTVINIVFGVSIIVANMMGKNPLKLMIGQNIQMNDEAWRTFANRWAGFFFCIALTNEIVWRSFSEEAWVNFKIFGLLGFTMLFMMANMPFLYRNSSSFKK